MVYDNVKSEIECNHYWPRTTKGRVIVTTSDRSMIFSIPGEKLEVEPWSENEGWRYLFHLLGRDDKNNLDLSEKEAAVDLSGRLSGHALSISLIAGLIFNGGCSTGEFMDMYEKDPDRIHGLDNFDILWKRTFKELDKKSHSLLRVMSWLMPDSIPQELFEKGVTRGSADGLEFCLDKFE